MKNSVLLVVFPAYVYRNARDRECGLSKTISDDEYIFLLTQQNGIHLDSSDRVPCLWANNMQKTQKSVKTLITASTTLCWPSFVGDQIITRLMANVCTEL
jgi:hypothetical protein